MPLTHASMNQRYAPSETVIAREVGGEEVLLDMATGAYFGLNEVGTAIWQALEREPADAPALAQAVVGQFAVSVEQAEADARTLLGELAERGLITLID
jgi:PqqD family protein of HPr-rel-A system